jgi:proteasome lid subunit RPN8/RPN11
MAQTVIFRERDFASFLQWAREHLPEEACGLLAGRDEKDAAGNITRHIEKLYLLTNTDHSPEHFSMDPKEQLQAVQDMRKSGWTVVGNIHSHPSSPSRQSREDIRLSFNHSYSYLIVSLMDPEVPVVRSFHCENGVSSAETLVVEKENTDGRN